MEAYTKYKQLLVENEGKLGQEQNQLDRSKERSIVLRKLTQVCCGKVGHEFGDWYRAAFDEDVRRTCKRCGMDSDDAHDLITWVAGYEAQQE